MKGLTGTYENIIDWDCFGKEDIEDAFIAEGHSLLRFFLSINENLYDDPDIMFRLSKMLRKETPDIVFSFNYFPVISHVCMRENIRYFSWVYDSPYIRLYSWTVVNACNVICVFDKEVYLEFHRAGITTVHYLPLAANPKRLDGVISSGRELPFICQDISFVGSLYTEQSSSFDQMVVSLSDYARGYLDGLMTSQKKNYGYNFIPEALGPIIDDLDRSYPVKRQPGGVESQEYYYAYYVINQKITSEERMELLGAITQNHGMDLFIYDTDFTIPGLRNYGPVNYDYDMPLIFRQSKINLNISLRSIRSGIPLRAFDIMGCGGFLLSNFQRDFLDYFVPGEDFVFYENKEDLLWKIDYYLEHEEERQAIARNGYDKVSAGHTYRHRIKEMLDLQ